jgi:hypothetical protein
MQRISGGLVMDRDGDIAGMTFDCASPKTAVLPSFIIKKLIEMESNFRYKTTRNLTLLLL